MPIPLRQPSSDVGNLGWAQSMAQFLDVGFALVLLKLLHEEAAHFRTNVPTVFR